MSLRNLRYVHEIGVSKMHYITHDSQRERRFQLLFSFVHIFCFLCQKNVLPSTSLFASGIVPGSSDGFGSGTLIGACTDEGPLSLFLGTAARSAFFNSVMGVTGSPFFASSTTTVPPGVAKSVWIGPADELPFASI